MSEVPSKPRNPYGELAIYSHSFIIKGNCDRVLKAARTLLDRYSEKKWEKVKVGDGEFVNRQVIDKRYGTAFPDGVTFQFHKGQFNEFKTLLQTMEVYIDAMDIYTAPVHTPRTIDYDLREGRVLRDYQEDAMGFARADLTSGDHFSKLIAMPTGTGKALDNETPMITKEKGIIPLKEVIVGDEIMSPDGNWTTVLGVHPQGLREKWTLETKDGRHVDCDREHNWEVFCADGTETITTAEIARRLDDLDTEVYIPFFDPLQYFAERDDYFEVTSALIIAVSRRGILQNGNILVQSSSFEHAQEIMNLAHSLGSESFIGGSKGEYWVTIINRFLTDRLLDAIPESGKTSKGVAEYKEKIKRLKGLEINRVFSDGVADMTCIEVDHHSHLFVLANFIVTHNTVTSCAIAAKEKTRWLVSVLPKYKDKWGSDAVENLNLKPKEVMIVENTDQLRGLIDMCKTQGTKKLQPVIIVTLTTLATFFKLWMKDPQGCIEDYGCEPMDLWRILDIGTVSVDESHEHIYSVFLLAMHLHGVKFISMSGTFLDEDPFVDSIQKIIFPTIKRYDQVKMEKYIDVEFLGFSFKREFRNKIRTTAFGRNDYSHVEFEKSIMRNKPVLAQWLIMVEVMIQYSYYDRRVKGDKLVVYAATTDMVNILVDRFKKTYPELIIKRYAKTEGDKYENILSADITGSTLQSSGTAVDIPALITVICTTMVSSAKTNLQMLGRLRNLIGKQMKCLLPFCKDIPKHRAYTAYRADLFKDRSKTIKTYYYDKELG